jgi:hypothetical protein
MPEDEGPPCVPGRIASSDVALARTADEAL